jgi:hypothetical protein
VSQSLRSDLLRIGLVKILSVRANYKLKFPFRRSLLIESGCVRYHRLRKLIDSRNSLLEFFIAPIAENA